MMFMCHSKCKTKPPRTNKMTVTARKNSKNNIGNILRLKTVSECIQAQWEKVSQVCERSKNRRIYIGLKKKMNRQSSLRMLDILSHF